MTVILILLALGLTALLSIAATASEINFKTFNGKKRFKAIGISIIIHLCIGLILFLVITIR